MGEAELMHVYQPGALKSFKVINHIVMPMPEGRAIYTESVIEYKEDDMTCHTITDIRGLVCTDPNCSKHIFDADFKQVN